MTETAPGRATPDNNVQVVADSRVGSVDALARVLDPDAFEPLPDNPSLWQVWRQVCREGTAREFAARLLDATGRGPGTWA